MNRIGLVAALAIMFAATAHAQSQIQWVDPAAPRAMREQPVEPSAAPATPTAPQLIMDTKRGKNDADARQCLQLATNDQIHRCAEKYRSHASRAKVVKAVPAADGAKPAQSKPASPARKPGAKATTSNERSAAAESVDSGKPAVAQAKPAETVVAESKRSGVKPVETAKSASSPQAASAENAKPK
jgi:hypothetical protein